MSLDITTLLLATLINALLMIAALVACVGLRRANGLRNWTLSLACQALGFGCLIAAASLAPRYTASVGVLLLSLSVSFTQVATARFIGAPARTRTVVAPAIALSLVHWLVYSDTQVTVGLTNLVIGLQTMWLAWVLLRDAGAVRWRWLVGVTALCNGLLVLGRAYLVAFHFDTYPAFAAPHPLNMAGMVLLSASMVLGTVGFLLAHRDEAERALQHMATFDGLTGLHNRRAWMDRGTAVLENPKTKVNPILLMLDLDHFKSINDTQGHPVGDRVLKLVGDVTKVALRRDDVAGRYGGEEFCILLNDCSLEDGQRFDARLRAQLSDWSRSELGFGVTFSAGMVVCKPGLTLADAIRVADDALYRAKSQGRNQTVLVT